MAACALIALAAAAAPARTLMTAEEAMALAFPACEVIRQPQFLTEAQQAAAAAAAKAPVASALVTRFEARCDGRTVGWGYLDTHRVRTLPETVLVALDVDGRLARVEVLAFAEPDEYRPRGTWYGQFRGRGPDGVWLGGAIRPVTGATLTARATVDAVRRVLAVHVALGTR